jgi:hypothetical protein
METLEQFIQSNPPALEIKRALTVQMSQNGIEDEYAVVDQLRQSYCSGNSLTE